MMFNSFKFKLFDHMTAAILVASTFTVMAGSAIAPALPDMLNAFSDIDNADFKVRMLIGVSAFTTMLFSVVAGRLCDRFGYISMIRAGLLVIVCSAIVGGLAQSLNYVLMSRCLLGAGVAATAVGCASWIGFVHKGQSQNRMTGYLGTAMEMSGLFYFMLAGVLTLFHWRFIFLIYALPIFILFVLRNEKNIRLSVSPTSKSSSFSINHMLIYLASFLALFSLNAYVTYIPFMFNSIDISSFGIGVALGLASVSAALASFLFPYFMASKKHEQVLFIGFCISVMGFLVLSISSNIVVSTFGLLVCGFGFGLKIPSMIGRINYISDSSNRGKNQANLTMTGFAGQFACPIIVESLGLQYDLGLFFLSVGMVCACFTLTLFYFYRVRR